MRSTLNVPEPLFVTAPNGGGLLYVHRHLLVPLLDEDATGLSVTADGLLWCVQADGSRALREIREGRLLTTPLAQTPLDLHDVLRGPDGTYAVFTETNQVVRLDDAFRVQERWGFGEEPDCAHVNCLAWHDGRLLVSMFGDFATHRGYKGRSRKAGRVVDVRSGETVIDGLSQPHSLVSVGERLWLCSSEDCELRVYGRDFRLERRVALPGYARGLAVGEHAVYVGISRSRNLDSDDVGTFTSAVVAVLDLQTLAVRGYVSMPWNEIYDIRQAPASFPVPDVLASLWGYERKQARAARVAREQQLTVTMAKANDAQAAWASEKVTRIAAEQRAQEQGDAARETQAALGQSQGELNQLYKELADARGEAVRAQADFSRAESELKLTYSQLEQTRNALKRTQADFVRVQGELKQACVELAQVQTQRDALQQELLQTRSELARHAARAAMLDQMLGSRSWRWTRPLRFLLRVLRKRGIDANGRQQLRRMVKAKLPALALSSASTSGLAGQQHGVSDYFVWGVIDWHFRIQRPQHLARELSRLGHRVFYISNNFIDREDAGFAVEALDADGRLYQVNLHLKSSPAIYRAPPDEEQQHQLRASLGRLLEWTQSRGSVSLVDHPYWLETARALPDSRLVYDCMDHHGGFADNTDDVLAREHELMRAADLLVVTSDWLDNETRQYNDQRAMVRNACEYTHFAEAPEKVFRDPQGRKIIGYYGAIAAWFDLDLVEKVARRFTDCLVLLVGADTTQAAQRQLGSLPNVQFTGEVPYADLPYYLYAFDVCMLPFQIIELTLATNPVKVYEYLSAGRNVVSVDLPEIRQFGDLVRTAPDHASFVAAIGEALRHEPSRAQMHARRQFASEQTWQHRVRLLDQHVAGLPRPRVSIVVVTYNNLDMTRACLDSLDLYSHYPNMEIIVVDNASADGTPDFLREWEQGAADRRIILNDDNRGFAAANNQGLEIADGDYLVMLNNDTYVTPGWVATMVAHLRNNPQLGMLGPVTNNIGNEARIDIAYADMDEMLKVSEAYTRAHVGCLTPLRTAAFFCVMLPRQVYEKIGELDEAFGIGMFEDDDYCRRVQQAGLEIACADDVFVHHHLSASFSKIKQEKRRAMFERNRAIYEAKWGPWVPHGYRQS